MGLPPVGVVPVGQSPVPEGALPPEAGPLRPGIQVGEPGVGGEVRLQPGDVGGGAAVQKLPVDLPAADDKGVLRCLRQQGLQGGVDLRPLRPGGRVPGENQVPAALEGAAAGEGGQGPPAQDDGVAQGQGPEALQILRDVAKLVPVSADAPAPVGGHDDVHAPPPPHTATGMEAARGWKR